ncbi:MAG: enoyl-CoA hydratase/isomerase family protein [Planctomycetaceae bacterium]|nr:enoyl-CoA hydratase/isomerase family protein [Planctomycetaceae bacterium]
MSEPAGIRVRVDAPGATVILDRPSACNALNRSMVGELLNVLDDLQQEKRIRAITLTGAGSYFSAGTDLREMARTMEQRDQNGLLQLPVMQGFYEEVKAMQQLLEMILRLPKPVLAAVNGPALGFGAALVLACDYVLAGPDAEIGWPETRWGLAPGLSAPLLTRRVSMARATSLLCFGKSVDSATAVRWGLFDEVVANELLWALGQHKAQELSGLGPHSVSLTKRLMCETIDEQRFSQLAVGAANTAASRTTLEAIELVTAFASGESRVKSPNPPSLKGI